MSTVRAVVGAARAVDSEMPQKVGGLADRFAGFAKDSAPELVVGGALTELKGRVPQLGDAARNALKLLKGIR